MKKTVSDLSDLIFTHYPQIRKLFRNLVSIKNIPISMTQLTCLKIIANKEQLTMSELADDLCMSNQQLTKVVDALVELELAERVYDAANRRKIYAKTTEKGHEILCSLKDELDKKLSAYCNHNNIVIDDLYDCFETLARYLN